MFTAYGSGTAVIKSNFQIRNMWVLDRTGDHLYLEVHFGGHYGHGSDALTHRDLVLWSLLLLLLLLSPKISSDIKASGLDRLPYLVVRKELVNKCVKTILFHPLARRGGCLEERLVSTQNRTCLLYTSPSPRD